MTLSIIQRKFRLAIYKVVGILLLVSLIGCDTSSQTQLEYQQKIIANDLITGDADQGRTLFAQGVIGTGNAPGCIGCHTEKAEPVMIGPPQAGMATLAANTINQSNYQGRASTVEGYLWEAVVDPNIHITANYDAVMFANYADRIPEPDIAHLVAYMLTLEAEQ